MTSIAATEMGRERAGVWTDSILAGTVVIFNIGDYFTLRVPVTGHTITVTDPVTGASTTYLKEVRASVANIQMIVISGPLKIEWFLLQELPNCPAFLTSIPSLQDRTSLGTITVPGFSTLSLSAVSSTLYTVLQHSKWDGVELCFVGHVLEDTNPNPSVLLLNTPIVPGLDLTLVDASNDLTIGGEITVPDHITGQPVPKSRAIRDPRTGELVDPENQDPREPRRPFRGFRGWPTA